MEINNFKKGFVIPYTQIPNEVLFSDKISFKAKAIWCYLNSKPDGWYFSADRIALESNDGVSAIHSGIRELIENGYLKSEKQNTGRIVYTLLLPKSQNEVLPECENRILGKSQNGKIAVINKKENNKKRNISNKELNNKDKSLLVAKPQYGNSEINEMFDLWEEMFGFKQKNCASNRNACYNMLRSKDKGKDWLKNTMLIVKESTKDRFAGKAVNGNANFADIQRNYEAIWLWGRKRWEDNNNKKGLIEI